MRSFELEKAAPLSAILSDEARDGVTKRRQKESRAGATSRLTLNYGTRYTLNFSPTEANGRGAVFNLKTQVLDLPRTARDQECCDFGPRARVAYWFKEAIVLRAGYGMVWFEQNGITSPFTLPQFPFIQSVGQLSLDGTTPVFLLRNGPSVQVRQPNANSGLG